MDVSHIQLASQAASSNKVMLGAEGGDLRSAIGPHWGSLPRQAAAVQHLHSSTASCKRVRRPLPALRPRLADLMVSHAWALGCMGGVCPCRLLQAST